MIVSEMFITTININQIFITIEVAIGIIESPTAILSKIGGRDKEAEIDMMTLTTGKEDITIEIYNCYDKAI